MIDGKEHCYPRGTLFCIGEFYGCEKDRDNVGLKMSATNVAKLVKQIDRVIEGKQDTIDGRSRRY